MSSYNRAQILGNLGADPKVTTTPSGIKKATFSVATSEKWTDKQSGEKKENTTWHNIVVWRGLAEIVEKYVKKGSKVFIAGKIDNRSYEHEGVKKYISEIVADDLVMLDGRRDGVASESASPASEPDLPF